MGGGSEIAKSPSTSFFLDKEYIIYFDEIDENYRIVGNHYTYTLLNSVGSDILENIRKIQDVAVGGITASDETEDVAISIADIEKKPEYPIKEQARTLVSVALFGIAGIITLFILKKNR